MRTVLYFLCYIVSFVYASQIQRTFNLEGEFSISSLTLTHEQLYSRCPVLKSLLKWKVFIEKESRSSIEAWECKDFFKGFPDMVVSMYFTNSNIELLFSDPSQIMPAIMLMDFCGNDKDLENSLNYLHNLCISKPKYIIEVFDGLVKVRKSEEIKNLGYLFLGKFSPKECRKDPELFISIIKLLYFGRKRDLEIWINYLHKVCIRDTKKAISTIKTFYEMVGDVGPFLLFLEKFTCSECSKNHQLFILIIKLMSHYNMKGLEKWINHLHELCLQGTITMVSAFSLLREEKKLLHLFAGKFMFEEHVLKNVGHDFLETYILPSIERLEIVSQKGKPSLIRVYSSTKKVGDGTLAVNDWLLTSLKDLKMLQYSVYEPSYLKGIPDDYDLLLKIIKKNTELVSVDFQLLDSNPNPYFALPASLHASLQKERPVKPNPMLIFFKEISQLESLQELTIQSHHGTITLPIDAMDGSAFNTVKRLNLIGFKFLTIQTEPKVPIDWKTLFEKFKALEEFQVEGSIFTPDSFMTLFKNLPSELSKLAFLDIRFCESQNSLVLNWEKFTNLKVLRVNSPGKVYFGAYDLLPIDNLSVKKLLLARLLSVSFEKLEVLDLKENSLEDSFFKDKAGLSSLKVLCLSNNQLGNGNYLANYIKNCPNLKELFVENCGLNETLVNSLLKTQKSFRKLDLRFNMFDEVTQTNLLAQSKELVYLAISVTSLQGIGNGALVLKDLQYLEINCNCEITNLIQGIYVFTPNLIRGINVFAPNLRTLILNNFELCDENIKSFSGFIKNGNFKELSSLTLRGKAWKDSIMDSLLEELIKLPRLSMLKLLRTNRVTAGEKLLIPELLVPESLLPEEQCYEI